MERREALNDPKVILRNVSIFDDDEVFDVLRFVTKGIRWKYTIALRVIVKDRVGIMKSNGLIYDGLISGQFHSYFWYDGEFSPMVSVGLTIHDWSFPRYYCTLRTKMRRGYINDSNLLTAVRQNRGISSGVGSEIRHVWQSQIEEWERRRRGMVWGARGVFSERDADAFAIRKVREYRRHIMQEKEKR
jgi:hypothetical protein